MPFIDFGVWLYACFTQSGYFVGSVLNAIVSYAFVLLIVGAIVGLVAVGERIETAWSRLRTRITGARS